MRIAELLFELALKSSRSTPREIFVAHEGAQPAETARPLGMVGAGRPRATGNSPEFGEENTRGAGPVVGRPNGQVSSLVNEFPSRLLA
jgi:hypothetical protein